MIVGIGMDLVSVARIGKMREEKGAAFLSRIFTADEQAHCLARTPPDEPLASRFAAKEAAMKALTTGWGGDGVGFLDIEVAGGNKEPPRLLFHGAAQKRAEQLGVTGAHLSLSHDGGVAGAVVVLEGRGTSKGEGER